MLARYQCVRCHNHNHKYQEKRSLDFNTQFQVESYKGKEKTWRPERYGPPYPQPKAKDTAVSNRTKEINLLAPKIGLYHRLNQSAMGKEVRARVFGKGSELFLASRDESKEREGSGREGGIKFELYRCGNMLHSRPLTIKHC